jgi:GMP synthase-like glutamine amidotransferase
LRIHYLQQVPFEEPVNIATWAHARSHSLTGTALFEGEALPSPDAFDALVLMGGPMSVHDEAQYPWLIAEKKLVEQSIKSTKPVLGVCLGAQLLADVLGAKVYRNKHKEIGWFALRHVREESVAAGFPRTFTAFHWHGETFDLPAGAVHLAESDGCVNQAFEFGNRALALQFHLEVTRQSVEGLALNCAADITSGLYVQSQEQMLAAADAFAAIQPLLFQVLDRWAGEATPA